MDVGDALIFDAQTKRLQELEHWLSLMILRHGEWTGGAWQYFWTDEAYAMLREALPHPRLAVAMEHDDDAATYILTTL